MNDGAGSGAGGPEMFQSRLQATMRRISAAGVIAVAAMGAHAATPKLQGLVVEPAGSVAGGVDVTAKVQMTAPVPADTRVDLESSAPEVVMVPRGVVVPAGRQAATFQATTAGVSGTVRVRLRAAADGVEVAALLAVTPPELSSIGFRPNVVTVGRRTSATVFLEGVAPEGGWPVAVEQQPGAACHFEGWLSGAQPVIEYPLQLTIPAGEDRVSFEVRPVSLAEPATSCEVTFVASAAGSDAHQAVLTVSASP